MRIQNSHFFEVFNFKHKKFLKIISTFCVLRLRTDPDIIDLAIMIDQFIGVFVLFYYFVKIINIFFRFT